MYRREETPTNIDALFLRKVDAARRLFSHDVRKAGARPAKLSCRELDSTAPLPSLGWDQEQIDDPTVLRTLRDFQGPILRSLEYGVDEWLRRCRPLLRRHFRRLLEIAVAHPSLIDELTVDWAARGVQASIQSMVANESDCRGDLPRWILQVLTAYAGEDRSRSSSDYFPRFFKKLDLWERMRARFLSQMESQLNRLVDESIVTAKVEPIQNAKTMASRKTGRQSRVSSAFVESAGRLWLNAQRQSSASRSGSMVSRVTDEELRGIASSLDSECYIPPADYLEKKCAEELRSFNSHNSNSKTGAIKTWSRLVSIADKDHLRGMRRLLSRCAEKLRSHRPALSGN